MSSVGTGTFFFFLFDFCAWSLAWSPVIILAQHPPFLLGSPCVFFGSWLKNHIFRELFPAPKSSQILPFFVCIVSWTTSAIMLIICHCHDFLCLVFLLFSKTIIGSDRHCLVHSQVTGTNMHDT